MGIFPVSSIVLPSGRRSLGQRGINIVDLMMWLVIAVLLMAAALQGIGYYQQATYVYHSKNDLAGAHQWAASDASLTQKVPDSAALTDALAKGNLSLTVANGKSNIAMLASSGESYCVGIFNPNISDTTRNLFWSSSDDPSNIQRGATMPASCGTNTSVAAPTGYDAAIALPPKTAPTVTGAVSSTSTTTAVFNWGAVAGASSYKVEAQIGSASWTTVAPALQATTYTLTGTIGQQLSLRVTAVNSQGSGPTSSAASVTLPSSTPSAFSAFGANTYSQLLIGGTTSQTNPVSVVQTGGLTGKTIDSIQSGRDFACALSSGNVYCWGTDYPAYVGAGSVYGTSTPTQISMTGALSGKTIKSLSVGNSNACVIASDNAAYCWGLGSNGALGNGSTGNAYAPVAVSTAGVLAGKSIDSISVGSSHVCALSGGAAYCWGGDSYSELGDGGTTQSNVPVAVNTSGALSGHSISSISVGDNHTCAIADGTAYCWGKAGSVGTTAASNLPVPVDTTGVLNGKKITYLASGGPSACVLADSLPYCWGGNTYGQLGNGTQNNSATPTRTDPYGVFDGRTVTSLSVGGSNACAIASGQAFCWGDGGSGRNGSGNVNAQPSPVAITPSAAVSGKTILTVSAGWGSTYVGLTNATPPPSPAAPTSSAPTFQTAVFGVNTMFGGGGGQLLPGSTSDVQLPTAVSYGAAQAQADVAGYHGCGITNGLASCWGAGFLGNLGGKVQQSTPSGPVPVYTDGYLRTRAVTKVSVSTNNACVLAGGQVFCWGSNGNGILGDSTEAVSSGLASASAPVWVRGLSGKNVTDIGVNDNNACAVADGKAYCWGYNNEGEVGNGTTGSPIGDPQPVATSGVLAGKTVTAISVGTYNSCAIADGGAYCWGDNTYGVLGNGTSAASSSPVAAVGLSSGVTRLATSNQNTCAVASGSAYCWGIAGYGTNGTTTSTWDSTPQKMGGLLSGKTTSEVVVGSNTACSLTNGAVYCWGRSGNGKLGDGATASQFSPEPVDTTGVLSGVTVLKLWGQNGSVIVGY